MRKRGWGAQTASLPETHRCRQKQASGLRFQKQHREMLASTTRFSANAQSVLLKKRGREQFIGTASSRMIVDHGGNHDFINAGCICQTR